MITLTMIPARLLFLKIWTYLNHKIHLLKLFNIINTNLIICWKFSRIICSSSLDYTVQSILAITGAYRTVSMDALQVTAGHLSLDPEIVWGMVFKRFRSREILEEMQRVERERIAEEWRKYGTILICPLCKCTRKIETVERVMFKYEFCSDLRETFKSTTQVVEQPFFLSLVWFLRGRFTRILKISLEVC